MAARIERSASSACGGVSPGGAPLGGAARMSVMEVLPGAWRAPSRRRSVGEVLVGDPLQVLPRGLLVARAAQQVGRVVGDDQPGAVVAERPAAQRPERALDAAQQLGG